MKLRMRRMRRMTGYISQDRDWYYSGHSEVCRVSWQLRAVTLIMHWRYET